MSASLNQLIPELQPFARDLVDAASAARLQPRVTSTRRSYAEQKRLYDRYVAGMSPYPAAPPGHSAHEYGFAFDMVVSPMDALADVGAFWQNEMGGVYAGARDPVHFEYPGFKAAMGSDIATAQALDDLQGAKDFLLNFIPGVGEVIAGVDLAEMLGIPKNRAVHLLTHPGEAVAEYPFLRLLGPPFIFYDVPLFK